MIRPLKFEDIKCVVQLELETLGCTLGEEMLSNFIDGSISDAYVYETDNGVIGYMSYNFDGDNIEICNICVAKEYQNKKVGTKLLSYVLNEVYVKGATSAIIDVRESNKRAIHVYEKLGFKTINIRKGYYSDKENALVLQKLFTPYMDLEDAYLQLFTSFEYNDGYVKIYDDIQTDKYYHNFYRVFDLNRVDDLLSKPFGNNISQIQVYEELPHLQNQNYEINNDIYMSAFISNISPIKKIKYEVSCLHESDYDSYVKFLYNDSLVYGHEFADKNSKRLASMCLEKKKTKILVLKENGNFIGSISYFVYNDLVKVEDFFILDNYQHKAYGTSLFIGAIDDIKKNTAAKQVILTADNLDTIKDMYYKMGFRKCGEYYFYRRK